MARIARVVVPGLPHHVTQRGDRGERVFFSDDDYEVYLQYLRKALAVCAAEVWAWCLMPNHVHLIAAIRGSEQIGRPVGSAGFVQKLEAKFDRKPARQKRGPKSQKIK